MAYAKGKFIFIIIIALAGLFVFVVWVLPEILPYNSRVHRNEYSAFLRIKNLNLAEHNYASEHPNVGFACQLIDLEEQSSDRSRVGLVDRILASGTKSGYHFNLRCAEDRSQKASRYTITATPVTPGTTGRYAFCTDQGGEIWYSQDGSAPDCLAKHKPIRN